MDSSVFELIYQSYTGNFSDGNSWKKLADKLNYPNSEMLRSQFRRERKKRGLPNRNQLNQDIQPNKTSFLLPRVGVLDIESLPMTVYCFPPLFNQNIGIEQVISDVCLLSWAGKFLNESNMFSDILIPNESTIKNDERIVRSCWDFISQCNYIIGHNFSGFDAKMLNTAFLKYDLPPLKYIVIDTLIVAKQNFRFSSNALKFINNVLGIRNKESNEGFNLWKKCHQGNQDALNDMLLYNIGDIYATEELFYKVRPYVRNLNIALFNEALDYQCPVCGSKNVKTEGYYFTSQNKYESVRCSDCMCVSRKKQSELGKDKKKVLLVNS